MKKKGGPRQGAQGLNASPCPFNGRCDRYERGECGGDKYWIVPDYHAKSPRDAGSYAPQVREQALSLMGAAYRKIAVNGGSLCRYDFYSTFEHEILLSQLQKLHPEPELFVEMLIRSGVVNPDAKAKLIEMEKWREKKTLRESYENDDAVVRLSYILLHEEDFFEKYYTRYVAAMEKKMQNSGKTRAARKRRGKKHREI